MNQLYKAIKLENRDYARLMTYSVIITFLKVADDGLGDESADELIDSILNYIRDIDKKHIDINEIFNYLLWKVQTAFKNESDRLENKREILETFSICGTTVIKHLNSLFQNCDVCKKGQPHVCKDGKLGEHDHCPECLGSTIENIAKSLYKNRSIDVSLPEVKLCSARLPVEDDRISSFRTGQRPYLGVRGSWRLDKNNPQKLSYAVLEFNPKHYQMKDYLVLPYILLHEYAVHGLANIVNSDRKDLKSYNKSFFFEGWMDFVIFQYYMDLLGSAISDEAVEIKLPELSGKIQISLPQSRRQQIIATQSFRKSRWWVKTGEGIARRFLQFLLLDCKPLFTTEINSKKAFYQISCDLALTVGLKRDELTLNLGKSLNKNLKTSFGREHMTFREFLFGIIKDSLTDDKKIDVGEFIPSFSKFADRNLTFGGKYLLNLN